MMIARIAVVLIAMAGPALAQTPLPPDQAYPCWAIQWAVASLPQEQLDRFKAKASPHQLAAGRACLGFPPESKRARSKRSANK